MLKKIKIVKEVQKKIFVFVLGTFKSKQVLVLKVEVYKKFNKAVSLVQANKSCAAPECDASEWHVDFHSRCWFSLQLSELV